jgi:hypothetical protein
MNESQENISLDEIAILIGREIITKYLLQKKIQEMEIRISQLQEKTT